MISVRLRPSRSHSRLPGDRSDDATDDRAGGGEPQASRAEAEFLFEEYHRPRDHHQVVAEQETAEGRDKGNEYDVEDSFIQHEIWVSRPIIPGWWVVAGR